MLYTILIILLVLILFGALPQWPYNRYGYGYYPSGFALVLLILVIVLILRGRP
jgi:hypothetical protein